MNFKACVVAWLLSAAGWVGPALAQDPANPPFDPAFSVLDLSKLPAYPTEDFFEGPFYVDFREPIVDVSRLRNDYEGQGHLTDLDCLDLSAALPVSGPWLSGFALDVMPTVASDCGASIAEALGEITNLYCDPRIAMVSICGGDPATPVVGPVIVGRQGPVRTIVVGDVAGKQPETTATDRSYPEVVALTFDRNEVHCTGTIVSDSAILTAAHCVCDAVPTMAFIGSTIISDNALNQGYSEWLDLEPDAATYPGFCEGWRQDDRSELVDLAIVFPKQKIRPEFIGTMARWHFGIPGPSYGTAVGFGASEANMAGGTKRYADIPVTWCGDPEGTGCVHPWEFVSNNAPGDYTDTCFRDSGGPVFYYDPQYGDIVYGVTSRGIAGQGEDACGAGGIYVTWIRNFNERYEEVEAWLASQLD